MFLVDWFLDLFDKEGTLGTTGTSVDLRGEIFYKELAIEMAINIIGNALASCDFNTVEKGKRRVGEVYYSFNVSPNQNQNKNDFWRAVVKSLVRKNECLILQEKGAFFIADSWRRVQSGTMSAKYENIKVNGESVSSRDEAAILFFKFNNENVKVLIDGLYSDYSKLIKAAGKKFKRKSGQKGTLDVPTSYPQTPKATDDLNELFDVKFKKFYEAEGDAVLPLTGGLKYNDLSSKAIGGSESRDIRALIDDVFDYVAQAFNIPPQLLRGAVADTSNVVTDFLTFCIKPLAVGIESEVNRKLYKKEAYLEKTYMKIDYTKIRISTLKDIAGALDILFRIGAHTINDNLRVLGLEEVDEVFANERYVTKNYQKVNQKVKG